MRFNLLTNVLPDNVAEKRKSWIYEVPLPSIHHLREALHGTPYDEPFPPELFEKYDTPVLAGAVKLWMLELEPPLAVYESYDDIRKIYPTGTSCLSYNPAMCSSFVLQLDHRMMGQSLSELMILAWHCNDCPKYIFLCLMQLSNISYGMANFLI